MRRRDYQASKADSLKTRKYIHFGLVDWKLTESNPVTKPPEIGEEVSRGSNAIPRRARPEGVVINSAQVMRRQRLLWTTRSGKVYHT